MMKQTAVNPMRWSATPDGWPAAGEGGPANAGAGLVDPGATLHVVGLSLWKRHHLRSFLPHQALRFVRDIGKVPCDGPVAIWAGHRDAGEASERGAGRCILLEDGFLRSCGLGADLVRPLSWVADPVGIHFDASRPSALELLLQQRSYEPSDLLRAARLRERIVEEGISKYNVGGLEWRPSVPDGRAVVLAVGQVENDASLRHGAPGARSNLELVMAARQAHPEAWLVYKPHPDVVSGLRAAGPLEHRVASFCDEVVSDAPITSMLDRVDVVHVLTSLAGFEALLRNRAVHCHGLPFYAGWGLTTDSMRVMRRSRRLSLDELVAGTLIHYPMYVSRRTGKRCTVEQALDDLIVWRRSSPDGVSGWRRLLRPLLRRS